MSVQIFTRWKLDSDKKVVKNEINQKPILEFLAIKQSNSKRNLQLPTVLFQIKAVFNLIKCF